MFWKMICFDVVEFDLPIPSLSFLSFPFSTNPEQLYLYSKDVPLDLDFDIVNVESKCLSDILEELKLKN